MTKIILSFGSFRSLPTGRQARYHAQAAFQRMMSGMVNGDLKIFPNPANGSPSPNPPLSRAGFILINQNFDELGNVVRTETLSHLKSPIKNLKSFSPRVYFTEVKTGKEVYRAKS